MYTTGEMAKLCNVTVRTVQYYDNRSILSPSTLTEGGRRLYDEDDLKRLKIICFLRDLGLPIDSIKQLFEEEHPESVIAMLLAEQSKALKAEVSERQERLRRLDGLQAELAKIEHFTVDAISDIAHIMENKKKVRRTHAVMLAVGLAAEAIEAGGLVYGFLKGIWWPYLVGLAVVITLTVWISVYYWKRTAYVCPQCHHIFKPRFGEAFWARHTPSTRKLTCIHCGHHGFCIETYGKDENHASH